MLGHTRKHHTGESKYISEINRREESASPWREVFEEGIEKYSEIGLMLRGARYKASLTQKELAKQIGVKPHHISEMEHGKRPIGKKMAYRLGKIFDVDYRVFL